MKRLTALAMAGALVLGTMAAMAGDKTQSRRRAKDGSGDNCKLNASCMRMDDALRGNGKCQQKRLRKRDGSCGGSCDGTGTCKQ